jgi:hypothetical protein
MIKRKDEQANKYSEYDNSNSKISVGNYVGQKEKAI